MKAVLAVIGAVLVAAIIGVAGWQFGWWLEEKNVDRQVRIDNRNKGVQVAWRDEARNTIADFYVYDQPGLQNQAAQGALRVKACSLIDRLTDSYLDEDLVKFERTQC